MSPITPGSLLAGRFRLEDLLEETAGARFWRATDQVLMRDVAVHVLDEHDPRVPAMLAAVRTSAAVTVPHLLRVLDAAVEDGVLYVVNEWGNGSSLDRLLLEGPLSPRKAAWMMREVADALVAAHRAGVAHGRLIPENVMISENGSVKLIGFVVDGILHGRSAAAADLSPIAVDVHDLAGLLYAALVNKWPGYSESTLAPAPRDHGRVLRPRQVRAGVPRPLDRICELTLGADSPSDQDRITIGTAAEIKAALSDFLGEQGEPTVLGSKKHTDLTEALSLPDFGDTAVTPAVTTATGPFTPVEASVEAPIAAREPAPSSKTPYVGMGGGQTPATWGPEEPSPVPASEPQEGTPWLRLPALLAIALVVLIVSVFAFSLGRGSDEDVPAQTPRSESPVAATIEIAEVDDFDPFQDGGTPEENPAEVPLATDGDPETAWTTSTYLDGPDITAYKAGVGLLLDLGSEQPVSEVALTLQGEPSDVQLLAAPRGAARPDSTDQLSSVASQSGAGTSVTLRPGNLTTRYLVVWFTGLPAVDGGFRGAVAEIVVRS